MSNPSRRANRTTCRTRSSRRWISSNDVSSSVGNRVQPLKCAGGLTDRGPSAEQPPSIGMGADHSNQPPPKPPGVRVRTGRFGKSRSGESRDSQAVDVPRFLPTLGRPRAVALRLARMVNSAEDLHLQDHVHALRTNVKGPRTARALLLRRASRSASHLPADSGRRGGGAPADLAQQSLINGKWCRRRLGSCRGLRLLLRGGGGGLLRHVELLEGSDER